MVQLVEQGSERSADDRRQGSPGMKKPLIVFSTSLGFLVLSLTVSTGLGPVGRLFAQNKSAAAAPAAGAAKKPSPAAQQKIDAALKALSEARDALAREGL